MAVMGYGKISERAKLQARRILGGKNVTEQELRSVIAQAVLGIDEVTNVMQEVKQALWSKEQLHVEIQSHCTARRKDCPPRFTPRQELLLKISIPLSVVAVIVALCYTVLSLSLINRGHGEKVADTLQDAVQSIMSKGVAGGAHD